MSAKPVKPSRRHKWYAYVTWRGTQLRIPLGTNDKGTAKTLCKAIDAALDWARSRAVVPLPMPDSVRRWLDVAEPTAIRILSEYGILDTPRAMSDLVAEWVESVDARGVTSKHSKELQKIVTEVAEACNWHTPDQITADSLERYLYERRTCNPISHNGQTYAGISYTRSNRYVTFCRAFAEWLRTRGLVAINPIDAVSKLKQSRDPRHQRRALTPNEITSLIEAVTNDGRDVRTTVDGIRGAGTFTGADRAVMYQLMIYTGLRLKETMSLTPASFTFGHRIDGVPGTVHISGRDAKAGLSHDLPLVPVLADAIQRHLSTRGETPRLFDWCAHSYVNPIFREDLVLAGIDRVNAQGEVLDLHALRHTTAVMLSATSLQRRAIQSLMRLSTGSLLDVYSRSFEFTDVAGWSELADTA